MKVVKLFNKLIALVIKSVIYQEMAFKVVLKSLQKNEITDLNIFYLSSIMFIFD